jgi:hypothetical protein
VFPGVAAASSAASNFETAEGSLFYLLNLHRSNAITASQSFFSLLLLSFPEKKF